MYHFNCCRPTIKVHDPITWVILGLVCATRCPLLWKQIPKGENRTHTFTLKWKISLKLWNFRGSTGEQDNVVRSGSKSRFSWKLLCTSARSVNH